MIVVVIAPLGCIKVIKKDIPAVKEDSALAK